MRKWIVIVGIVLQIGVLAYMVYGRESVISNGKRIYLATAPVDPQDPFRGDYVRLHYPLNSFSSAPGQWVNGIEPSDKDDIVYAVLQQMTGDQYDVAYFTDEMPADNLFLRGRRNVGGFWFGGRMQDVRYGIEQVFVEQGRGIDIENRRGIRGGMQTAMEVQVAVDNKGTAVLIDYRWSPLAIQLELTENFQLPPQEPGAGTPDTDSSNSQESETETPDTDSSNSQESETPDTDSSGNQDSGPQLIVTVKNVSDRTLTLNNPGDDCGFQLIPANRVNSMFKESINSCGESAALTPLVLAPDQEHVLNIRLDSPRWFVDFSEDGETVTGDVRTFTGNPEFFRIVYQSSNQPDATESEGYWIGNLISQAFTLQGRID